MQPEYYKESVKDALYNLIKVNGSIFDSLISISMQGELKEWNKQVPVGETHQFDFELFKNSDDINIQLLVQIIEKVDEIFEKIKNINDINIEE